MSTSRIRRNDPKMPRRDGTALGFGVAFLVFGFLGALHSAGLGLKPAWTCAIVLAGTGIAGLVSLLIRERY